MKKNETALAAADQQYASLRLHVYYNFSIQMNIM